jgi:hypothetical protein
MYCYIGSGMLTNEYDENVAVMMAKNTLDALDKNNQLQNKWISVKDKLPTPNEVVLIFWDNKITSGSYKYFHNGYFQHGAATQLKVTHWMPLPNKPISTTED